MKNELVELKFEEFLWKVKRKLRKSYRNANREKEKVQATKSIEVDALVHGAEEGRDKLRKAAERSKYPETRRSPNEGTQYG